MSMSVCLRDHVFETTRTIFTFSGFVFQSFNVFMDKKSNLVLKFPTALVYT